MAKVIKYKGKLYEAADADTSEAKVAESELLKAVQAVKKASAILGGRIKPNINLKRLLSQLDDAHKTLGTQIKNRVFE